MLSFTPAEGGTIGPFESASGSGAFARQLLVRTGPATASVWDAARRSGTRLRLNHETEAHKEDATAGEEKGRQIELYSSAAADGWPTYE